MRFGSLVRRVIPLLLVGGMLACGFLTREYWQAWLLPPTLAVAAGIDDEDHHHDDFRLRLSPQAKANLGLRTGPVALTDFWRSEFMPGEVVERAGYSNRGVTTTLAGIVTQISAIPGQAVKPGDPLFTLRLTSEYLQNAQAQFYKTARDLEINLEEQQRLKQVADSGALFKGRLLELGYEERRLRAALDTHRHDLAARGLSATEIQQVLSGNFQTEVIVRVPSQPGTTQPDHLEVEELRVQLGESVQVGQILAYLANHDALDLEGKAFEQEIPLLHRVASAEWPIAITVFDNDSDDWPPLAEPLRIRFVANHVDPKTRLVRFYLSLANQARDISGPGGQKRLWRFRPGQRVRLALPVEKIPSVYVLPRAAVVREGAETFVFRVNGDLLERRAVHVIHQDHNVAVLANDGSVTPGNVLALTGAVALNRALKAQQEAAAGGHGHHHDHDH